MLNPLQFPKAMTTPPSRPLFPENSPDPAGEFPIGVKEYIFYLLFQAARHRDMAVDALLGPIGLSLPAWRAMLVVRRIENCTMKALARYSSMDRTTLTRTVVRRSASSMPSSRSRFNPITRLMAWS